jgi:hypothetical protein
MMIRRIRSSFTDAQRSMALKMPVIPNVTTPDLKRAAP